MTTTISTATYNNSGYGISVISISSDSSDKSVGSSPSRIILFGTIPVEILAETPTILFVVPTLPHTSPFLYIDSSDNNTSERQPSQDPYEDTVARVRKMLTVGKRVRALPSGRLASRYPPDHSSSDYFSSDDSSSNSSSQSSSDYSLDYSSGHSLPDSSVDAPATIFAGPSRKRCRSLTGIVSYTRTRSLESYEAYTELNIDSDVQADINVDIVAAEATIAREANVGVKVDIGSDREDEAEEEAESRDKGTIEIGVDKVLDIKSAQREQEHGMLAASEQRTDVLDRIGVLESDNMRL
ncbi:hypothetical protein Tco_0610595 [Tanacetum coccineum]